MGVYNVSIVCANSFSSSSYSVLHTVQAAITGLSVPLPGGYVNTPFRVQFQLASGTSPAFTQDINGQPASQITFDPATLTGTSAFYSSTAGGIYYVNITATNMVSQAQLYQPFEIGAQIVAPGFLVLSTPFTSTPSRMFHFASPITFKV